MVLAALANCQVLPEPEEPEDTKPPPVEPTDGGDVDRGSCAQACVRLAELGCGDDPDCVAACENIEKLHRDGESEVRFNPACVTRASSCAEADGC